MTTTRAVCLSLGHLGGFGAGLGEFAWHLGTGIAARREAFSRAGIGIAFHVQASLVGAFGSDVAYVAYQPGQQWWPWKMPGCALWHNLFQHNVTRPPHGVPHRLLTVHDLNYRHDSSGQRRWRDAARTWLAIRRSNEQIAISRFVADDLQEAFGSAVDPLVVYNGASDLTGSDAKPVDGLRPGSFFFHISRMAPSKNVEAIIALARVWPEQRFVLAGPGWGDSKAIAERLGDSIANVQVLLEISEETKAWLLGHCRAFLFPSLSEGFGLPAVEAMYFGTPTFLADRTCLPEIGGACAAYFDDFSPAAMRAVIERELPRLEAGRRATRERATSFSWERCVDGYVDRYARRLGEPRLAI